MEGAGEIRIPECNVSIRYIIIITCVVKFSVLWYRRETEREYVFPLQSSVQGDWFSS